MLGGEADEVRRYFRDVEQVAVFTCEYCMPYESHLPIYVARGPTMPAATVWSRVKVYR